MDVVTAMIINGIGGECGCPLSAVDIFSDDISCGSTGHVIYRAGLAASSQLDTEQLHTALNEWIAQTSTLVIDNSLLQVDHDCPLVLSSFDDPICSSTTTESPDTNSNSDRNIIPLLVGAIGGIIVGAVSITIVIVILIVKCRGKTDKIRYALNGKFMDYSRA